jgi:hypothetical protein
MKFEAVSPEDLHNLSLDGSAPIAHLSSEELLDQALTLNLPKLDNDQHLRVLLGALLRAENGKVHAGSWSEVRDEARGLLLLAIRRDGRLSASSAQAATALNKPAVVEKYKAMGNRWTMSEASRDPADSAIARARTELGIDESVGAAEWLSTLADALEAPVDERPWWTSKFVLIVLGIAAVFVLVHVLLLVRVLMKVHSTDSNVLIYPIAGLSASAVVGAIAICIHKLSEPKGKAQ